MKKEELEARNQLSKNMYDSIGGIGCRVEDTSLMPVPSDQPTPVASS